MSVLTQDIRGHWETISPLLTIRDEAEYDRAVDRLNLLLDEVGTDENHPLYSLLDVLGTLVHAYEEEHHPTPPTTGIGVLQFLMEEHGLTESDLPELGSPMVVSRLLSGQQELSLSQINVLAERFHVSPAVFV